MEFNNRIVREAIETELIVTISTERAALASVNHGNLLSAP
jgi:hypothetical protein